MIIIWVTHHEEYPVENSDECETYSSEVHERSGKFILRLYDQIGAEKKLKRAESGVTGFRIKR